MGDATVTFENKTREELERYFIEGFGRLVRAGEAYDKGHWSEAPDIAKEIYNFVYDPGNKPASLLSHLGLKDTLRFVSSTKESAAAGLPPGAVLTSPEYNLIEAPIGFSGMDYQPLLGSAPRLRLLPFAEWYEEIVLAWRGHESIERGELIEFIRHNEGGGHIGGRYVRGASTDKMVRLMRGEYVDGYMELDRGEPVGPPPYQPAYATLRQIGWEIEETLRRASPQLVAQVDFQPAPGPRMSPVKPE